MNLDINIYKKELSEKNKNLLANVNLVLIFNDNLIQINKILIIKGKEGDAFVSLPAEKYTNKKGETQYQNIINFNQKLTNEIKNKILYKFNNMTETYSKKENQEKNDNEGWKLDLD